MPFSSHQISGVIGQQMQQHHMMVQQGMQSMGPTMSPSMGASQYPPQFAPQQQQGMLAPQSNFNFGVQQAPTMGTHVGAAGMGAVGAGAFGAVTGAAGVAEMMGATNPAIRGLGMMDPFGAAFNVGGRAMGMGGRMGMGMGGQMAMGAVAGTGVGALAMAGMEGLAMTGRNFAGGFREQQGLNQQLGGLSFGNASSPTGRGFGPQQTGRIGEVMRSFEAADPFTTMSDMNQMMKSFTDMGMHQGIRDAEEFSGKFKKMAETVRSMAMSMGTTMQEAAGTFGQMRQAGFFTAAEVMGNTTQANLMKGVGMSPEQFGQMQMQGAGAFRAQSMSGMAGAKATTNMASMFAMNPNRERQLMDITGAGDLAGASAAMGQRLAGAGAQFFNTQGAGQAALMGLGKTDEEGRFTGGINQDVLQQMASGQISLKDLSSMGQKNLAGKGRESFKHRSKDITQNLMQQEDFLPAIMKMIEKESGGNEDIAGILGERLLGLDRREFDEAKLLVQDWAQNKGKKRRRVQEELAAQVMQAEMSRNRSLGGLSQKFKGGISDIFAGIRQAGADIATDVETRSMQVSDEIFGVERFGISAGGASATAAQLAGGGVGGVSAAVEGPMSGAAGALQSRRGSGAVTNLRTRLGAGGALRGSDLGVSQARQKNLGSVVKSLQGDKQMQDLVLEANAARLSGNKDKANQVRRAIHRRIKRQLPKGESGESAAAAADREKTESAYILSQIGGSQLASDQLIGEMGAAGPGGVEDLEAAKDAFRQASSEAMGSSVNWGNLAFHALTVGGGTVAMAALSAVTGKDFMPDITRSALEEMTEGGAGLGILSAISGKEVEFQQLYREANEAGTPEERAQILKDGMKTQFGREVTDADVQGIVAKFGGVPPGIDDLKKLTGAAKTLEGAAIGGAQLEAASKSMATTKFGTLEGKAGAVRAQLVGGDKGRTFAEGQSFEKLVLAATAKGGGELDRLAGMGGAEAAVAVGGRGIMAAKGLEAGSSVEELKKALHGAGIGGAVSAEALKGLEGKLSREQIDTAARTAARMQGAVELGSGAMGTQFTGGIQDPQIREMTRLTEMIDIVYSDIKGKDPSLTAQNGTQQVANNGQGSKPE